MVCLTISPGLSAKSNSGLNPKAVTPSDDVFILEITDDTLSSVYYHNINFNVPAKIVFTNLKVVEGMVYFYHNYYLEGVEFPQLEKIGGNLYVDGNNSLKSIFAPKISIVHDYIYISGNRNLTHLDICNLTAILPSNGGPETYYYIKDNTEIVDSAQPCWGSHPPTDLMLSNLSISENLVAGSVIGNLSAMTPSPGDSITFFFTGSDENDSSSFIISGNVLKSAQAFNYEAQNEYHIEIGARNQFGEKVVREFTISILDIVNEDIDIIEITDYVLSKIEYHKISFQNPTKIVFTNLTVVKGMVYFHENVNLVSVEFPQLVKTEGIFYFYGNLSLDSISAPKVTTIYNNLYICRNTSLTYMDICNLSEILPSDEQPSDPYYYIEDNTEIVDSSQPCWGSHPPTDLKLSNLSISENEAAGTKIGILSASVGNPDDQLTFYLANDYEYSNHKFSVKGNELVSNHSLNYEDENEYTVEVGVRNQFGEKVLQLFTIKVLDVEPEKTDTILITDTTLRSVYYHESNFENPTVLVFTNLSGVEGIIYFYRNSNLAGVEFPKLENAAGFLFFAGNMSLQSVSAPKLYSVHDYVYVEGNSNLQELDICGLSEILPVTNSEPYYYIRNNPALDFETTCLIQTQIYFENNDSTSTDSTGLILIGIFSSNLTEDYTISYFFADELGNAIPNDDFVINDNMLYLSNGYESYTDKIIPINIGAIRYSDIESANINQRKVNSNHGDGLNEKIIQSFNVTIPALTSVNRDQINHSSIIIYPNPSTDKITLKGIDFNQVMATEIFDCFGKTIVKEGNPNNELDISSLPPGVYFLKISTAKEIFTSKIIKR
jgi:hypothetical protein